MLESHLPIVDTMTGALMIISCIFGVHLLILLYWRYVINWRYYAWKPRGPTRIVLVSKPEGARLGIGVAGLVVKTVDADSPCARLLSTGDRLLLVNRKRLWSDKHASRLIRHASQLYLLVSSPPPGFEEEQPLEEATPPAHSASGGRTFQVSWLRRFNGPKTRTWRNVIATSRVAPEPERVEIEQRQSPPPSPPRSPPALVTETRVETSAHSQEGGKEQPQLAVSAVAQMDPAPPAAGLAPQADAVLDEEAPPSRFAMTAVNLPMRKLPSRMRTLYGKVAKAKTLQPSFHSLPEALFWPNLEVRPCAALLTTCPAHPASQPASEELPCVSRLPMQYFSPTLAPSSDDLVSTSDIAQVHSSMLDRSHFSSPSRRGYCSVRLRYSAPPLPDLLPRRGASQ